MSAFAIGAKKLLDPVSTKNIWIIVVSMVILIYLVYTLEGNQYWVSIGDKWDRMLNPCDYEECELNDE